MDISLYNQSALLAALEIFVGGHMLLRDTSAVMFEILFPKVLVFFLSAPTTETIHASFLNLADYYT